MGTIIFDHVTEDMRQIVVTKQDDGSITFDFEGDFDGGVTLSADQAFDLAMKVSQETA